MTVQELLVILFATAVLWFLMPKFGRFVGKLLERSMYGNYKLGKFYHNIRRRN